MQHKRKTKKRGGEMSIHSEMKDLLARTKKLWTRVSALVDRKIHKKREQVKAEERTVEERTASITAAASAKAALTKATLEHNRAEAKKVSLAGPKLTYTERMMALMRKKQKNVLAHSRPITSQNNVGTTPFARAKPIPGATATAVSNATNIPTATAVLTPKGGSHSKRKYTRKIR